MCQTGGRTQALLFAYNADTGLGNAVLDIGHKVISPSTYHCQLCALTHGVFAMRQAWRDFVHQLPLRSEFLHRDEFHARYGQRDVPLPAVFLSQPDGSLTELLSAEAINAVTSLQQLQEKLMACLDSAGLCTAAEGPAEKGGSTS